MCRPILLALLLFASSLLADQVVLKNGDRLSGTVVRYDGKQLVFKSDLAGPVTIAWDSITTLTSTAPINVGLKDGQNVLGVLTTAPDGRLQVATSTAGNVTVARDSVVYIRSKEDQAAYQVEID